MSMGTGAFLCKSTKQKLNTKSSTEAELVGATDYLPNSIWSKMFLEAQGHKIVENVFEQDNVNRMVEHPLVKILDISILDTFL
jgi:hypothetical protein